MVKPIKGGSDLILLVASKSLAHEIEKEFDAVLWVDRDFIEARYMDFLALKSAYHAYYYEYALIPPSCKTEGGYMIECIAEELAKKLDTIFDIFTKLVERFSQALGAASVTPIPMRSNYIPNLYLVAKHYAIWVSKKHPLVAIPLLGQFIVRNLNCTELMFDDFIGCTAFYNKYVRRLEDPALKPFERCLKTLEENVKIEHTDNGVYFIMKDKENYRQWLVTGFRDELKSWLETDQED